MMAIKKLSRDEAKAASERSKKRVDEAYAKFAEKNPGVSRKEWGKRAMDRYKARMASKGSGSVTKTTTVARPTTMKKAPSAAMQRVKAAADAAYEKFSANNPGVSRQEYSKMAAERLKSRKPVGQAAKAASAPKAAAAPKAPSALAEQGYQRYLQKNPSASRADYSAYAKGRVKDLAEQGYQKYAAKNPGASRADYSAYAKGRVKDMAAKARARKTGA